MIKWRGSVGGRPCVGLVLEEGNLKRLRRGGPIVIYKEEEIGLPFDLVIDYCKTAKEGFEKYKEMGLISKDTVIYDHVERKKN